MPWPRLNCSSGLLILAVSGKRRQLQRIVRSVEGGTRSLSKTEVFVVFNRPPHLIGKGAPSFQ